MPAASKIWSPLYALSSSIVATMPLGRAALPPPSIWSHPVYYNQSKRHSSSRTSLTAYPHFTLTTGTEKEPIFTWKPQHHSILLAGQRFHYRKGAGLHMGTRRTKEQRAAYRAMNENLRLLNKEITEAQSASSPQLALACSSPRILMSKTSASSPRQKTT